MTDMPNRLLQRPAARADSGAARERTVRPGPPAFPRPGGIGAIQGSRPASPGFDLLSDVFRCVRLTGSMFFLVDAALPWSTRAPAASAFARLVLPAVQHLVSYHVVTEGECWGGIEGSELQPMATGDILLIPHGSPYRLANPASAAANLGDAEVSAFFRRMAAGAMPRLVTEGGRGPQRTGFICGFLGCDLRPFNPILAALPPMLLLRGASKADDRLRHLTALALSELREQRPGSNEVLLRLSELMFIAAICYHVESLRRSSDCQERQASSDTVRGWLAGLHEPLVARVLALLHAQPERPWTLGELAGEAGTSRSVLAARFGQVVGQPPMRYLTAWRMQLATRLLAHKPDKVRTVALAVGYESEAAFSRAFNRWAGISPLAWRDLARRGRQK